MTVQCGSAMIMVINEAKQPTKGYLRGVLRDPVADLIGSSSTASTLEDVIGDEFITQ